LEKPQVREKAVALNLPTAGKPDSQETCFVPNNDYPALLQLLVPDIFRPGEIRSTEGRVLGRHEGIANYTIGQRKRLNVGSPVPLYVTGIDPDENQVIVGTAHDEALYRTEVVADDVNLLGIAAPPDPLSPPMPVTAKIRYNSTDQPATLHFEQAGGNLRLIARFAEPVRAVTPGQSLVCYQGEEIIAGGVIAG
jgi:tRNA-specific 2-thiouridylase